MKKFDKYVHGLIPGFLIHLGLGNMFFWSQITNKLSLEVNVSESKIHWIFVIMVFFLGLSASISGRLSERGVKLASFISLGLFIIGMMTSSIGLYEGSFNILLLGYGILTSIAIGIGYLIPIKNSMLWFPNNTGLSVGVTIFGFSLSSILSNFIVKVNYEDNASMIVLKMLLLSIVPMIIGSLLIKRPEGYSSTKWYSVRKVFNDVLNIMKSDRFSLLWFIIFFKLTAGITVIYNQLNALNYSFRSFSYNEIFNIVLLAAIFNGIGRIAAGMIVDRIPIGKKANLNYIIFGLPLLVLVATYFYHDWSILPVLLYTISFSYGFGVCCIPVIIDESFHTKNYIGTLQGVMFTSLCMSGLCGSILGYLLINLFNIPIMLSFITIMYLIGLILSAILINKIKKEGRYELP